jgi:hypothetical protein
MSNTFIDAQATSLFCGDSSLNHFYGTMYLSNSDSTFRPNWPSAAVVSSVAFPKESALNPIWDITNTHGALLPIVVVAAVLVLVALVYFFFFKRRSARSNKMAHPQNQYAPGPARY